MTTPLRALLIDDSEEDAFLLVRYLRKNGYEVESERVDDADSLRAALARGPWDIALCDYVMPLLGGEEALRIIGTEVPDLPVITISGNVGEEFAVNVMRAGAKDYVRKDNLPRLIPAIERELADAAGRRERRSLERQLHDAEVRANTLFTSMQQGVLYRDAQGKIIAANPAATRILGLTQDQIHGRTPLDPGWRVVREDGSPFPVDEYPAMVSLRTRQPTRDVVMGIGVGTGAAQRWIMIDAVPEFRAGEEAPYQVFSTFYDVTEQRKAAAAIRASEARFHEMAEVLPQTVWVAEPDGSVRDANRHWTEYSGLSDEQSHGDGWLQAIHPDDRERHRSAWDAARRAGVPYEVESRMRRADGVYRWFKTSGMPVRDATGAIVRWTGVCTDIEDLKRLEDEIRSMNAGLQVRIADADARLRESEERMALAFRASQDGIWDWNVEAGEVWYSDNWGEMLGYAPSELKPEFSTWRDGLHPDDRAWVEEAVGEVLRGERAYDMVFRLRHKDGHYVTVQSRGLPVRREPGGTVVRLIGTHHDITDLMRAEAALRAAVEELEAFNYSVSHDLRAPLRHIEGFTEILEQEYGAQMPLEARRYVEKVHVGSERMSRMIEALLHLSRVSRAALQRRRTDLSHLVKTSWADLSSVPGTGPATLVVQDLPEADVDPALLRQVFDNLLGNALKFTRSVAEPRIEVGVERRDAEPVFYVRDNGVGFDPQRADRLFTVFRRLHAESEFEGTGVGLSIVKRIVEKHGGRVWAESAPGDGATFFFTLPPRADS